MMFRQPLANAMLVLAIAHGIVACGGSSAPAALDLPLDQSSPKVTRLGSARLPGTEVRRTVLNIKPTPNVDEWDLPDLKGSFDALIPVAADFPLPEIPSRMHDVATMRNGRYLRPRIPTARLSVDGRIGIGFTAYLGHRTTLADGTDRSVNFMLYTPEKLHRKGKHYLLADDGSADMMSPDVSFVSVSEFLPDEAITSPSMYAVCDSTLGELDHELYGKGSEAQHRNPYPVSATAEAYDLTLITGNRNKRQELFSFVVRVIVENAKTPDAYIRSIQRVGEPVVAQMSYEPITHFEPNVTGDGRLIVFRASGTPGQGGGAEALQLRRWVDNDGVEHLDQFDIVYAYNPPGSGFEPCDPRGWSNLRPISYAHYDAPVRERYGFAKFPFRSPEGEGFRPGQETGMTYPWIDSRGTNLFFTSEYRLPISDETTFVTNEDFEMAQSVSTELDGTSALISGLHSQLPVTSPRGRPPLMLPAAHIKPLPSGCDGCRDTTPTEHASSTRGVGVAGLWTEGKMVILDGMMNTTDFGYLGFDDGHRLLRLYHGAGGVVRVGNGRTNTDTLESDDLDTYWPLNDSIIESHENRFNFLAEYRPAAPQDVVWTMNNGRAQTEVVFDDFMDPSVLIVSNMTASYSHNPVGPIKWLIPNTGDRANRPFRLQNLATGASVPAYGAVIGDVSEGTRIEPVALGGVDGKGFWLTEGAGVRYTVRTTYPAQAATGAYYSIFIDPRMTLAAGAERRLLTTPQGVVNVVGTALGLQLALSQDEWVQRVDLGGMLASKQWLHIGLERQGAVLRLFANGFQFAEVSLSEAPEFLRIATGDIVLGSPGSGAQGVRAWIDDFKVLARPLLNLEEPCNIARGSVVISKPERAAVALRYPAASHARVAAAVGGAPESRYLCAVNYRSENYDFLTRIPESERLGKQLKNIKPLQYGQIRPDERDNAFCVSCHRSPHPSNTMALEALEPRNLPAQLDVRRQPLQPYPIVIGHVPKHWLRIDAGPEPATAQIKGFKGDWLELDRYLLTTQP